MLDLLVINEEEVLLIITYQTFPKMWFLEIITEYKIHTQTLFQAESLFQAGQSLWFWLSSVLCVFFQCLKLIGTQEKGN